MKDLNFPVRSDNFGGVDRFWFVPESAILEADENGLVLLKENHGWFLGKATKYTLDFTCPSREKRGGTLFDPRLTGLISKYTPELGKVLAFMHNKKFVIIYKDKNGYLIQVGTKGQPLTFEYERLTGDSPAAKNGVRFRFFGTIRQAPEYYNREIVPATPGEGNVPEAPPVVIKINGNIVAIKDPGTTYEFFSDFTHEFETEQS